MPKVTLSGYIVVSAEDLDAVLRELPSHIELTRNEPGCNVFNVIQDQSDNLIFHVHEEFEDRTAFDSHQSRVQSSVWGRVTSNVQRHYQITETGSRD